MNIMNETRSTQAAARKRQWSLMAAVAAAPFLAALPARIARAQFPVSNNGHANDANNRVGSGGYNESSRVGSTVTSNDIVYSNVSGGRGFRGGLQSTDPLAFRGQTFRGSADTFISESSPSAVRGTPSAAIGNRTVQPFYSENRGVGAPAGYVPVVNGGGYVPPNTYQASQFTSQLSDTALGGSYRTGGGYGIPGNLNPTFGVNGAYAPYGTDARLGPIDSANQQSLIVVSPLSGVQQTPLNNAADNYFMSRTSLQRPQGGGRFQRIDEQGLQQMQQELQQQQQNQPSPNGQPAQQNPNELNQPMPQALEAPINTPLGTPIPAHPLNTAQPLNGGIQTQEGMYRTVATAAAQQTPVLDQLHERLDRYNGNHTPTAEEQENKFQADRKAAANPRGGPGAKPPVGATPGTPGTIAPGTPGTITPATPGRVPSVGTGTPGVPSVNLTPFPGAPKPDLGAAGRGSKAEPVKITSLATGVRAKGLAGLLTQAEELMKQGKFTSAVDQYSLAEQVAPNNPLIPLGQANAELGSASYRDAELHLRQAFSGDLALLHAQFDLNSLIGQQRVKTIRDDLKGLAGKEPNSEMPTFLLAYINYNTGHEAEAMLYLNDVDKREGHPDPVVARMRQHWYVPPAGGAKPAMPDLNK